MLDGALKTSLVNRSLKCRVQATTKVYLALCTPVWLVFVPFLGGYISCPSQETPPEEKKRREKIERSVDGCRMTVEAVERRGQTAREEAQKHNRGV